MIGELLDEDKAKGRSENKVCGFTNCYKQLELDGLGQMRTQGEKASGQDCKGSKRETVGKGESLTTSVGYFI
jgi:hypothetical protein